MDPAGAVVTSPVVGGLEFSTSIDTRLIVLLGRNFGLLALIAQLPIP